MTYNFDFNIQKDGSPYVTSSTAAEFIAELLENRVTSDKPILEIHLAESFRESPSAVDLNTTERTHIVSIISALPYDNYFKSKLLNPVLEDTIDGIPTEVPTWCLMARMDRKFVPEDIPTIGGMSWYEAAAFAVDNLPETTEEEKDYKAAAKRGLTSSKTTLRQSVTVSKVKQFFSMFGYNITDADIDQLFIEADLLEA